MKNKIFKIVINNYFLKIRGINVGGTNTEVINSNWPIDLIQVEDLERKRSAGINLNVHVALIEWENENAMSMVPVIYKLFYSQGPFNLIP